ncbi:MAG: 1-acyl-sn-glycerol-3-phosphate acyltransferase [Anaerolineae bacterium]|nr:1-acyl-sn-glycerol-3-phosphate acyltransferase [Anaerolineae bacterium]
MSETASPDAPHNEPQSAPRSVFSKRWKWRKSAPMRTFYNWLLRILCKLTLRMHFVNLHLLPKEGPLIILINHIHWSDPFLLLASVGRDVTPMAKVESFEDPRARWAVDFYGSIPVHRGEVDLQAIRAATELLAQGRAVILSPEGTRSRTGGLIRAQEGLAFLATRTKATLIPAGIVGTVGVDANLKRFRRTDVTITFGEPFTLNPDATGNGKVTRDQLRHLTDEAMHKLAAVLPVEMRGVYG